MGKEIKLSHQPHVQQHLDVCGQQATQLFFKIHDYNLDPEERAQLMDQLTLAEIEYSAIMSMHTEV